MGNDATASKVVCVCVCVEMSINSCKLDLILVRLKMFYILIYYLARLYYTAVNNNFFNKMFLEQ